MQNLMGEKGNGAFLEWRLKKKGSGTKERFGAQEGQLRMKGERTTSPTWKTRFFEGGNKRRRKSRESSKIKDEDKGSSVPTKRPG